MGVHLVRISLFLAPVASEQRTGKNCTIIFFSRLPSPHRISILQSFSDWHFQSSFEEGRMSSLSTDGFLLSLGTSCQFAINLSAISALSLT